MPTEAVARQGGRQRAQEPSFILMWLGWTLFEAISFPCVAFIIKALVQGVSENGPKLAEFVDAFGLFAWLVLASGQLAIALVLRKRAKSEQQS